MARILLGNNAYTLSDNESVLECLLRNEVAIPNSCRSAVCQSCLLKTKQSIEHQSRKGLCQTGLSPQLVEQGFFLACQSRPEEDLEISTPESDANSIKALVTHKEIINDTTCIIKLRPEKKDPSFGYYGGQFCNLQHEHAVIRSYSIASADDAQDLEFHIRRYEGGKMSRWIFDELILGQSMAMQGPFGTCYYTDDCNHSPLKLYGMGTGLAPMLGILRSAVAKQHTGKIELYACSRLTSQLYLTEELSEIAQAHSNIDIHYISQSEDSDLSGLETLQITDIYQHAVSPNIFDEKAKIFICGSENFVKKMKKQYFLAGAPLSNIRSDAFLQAKSD